MQYSSCQNNFSVYGNDAWVAHPFCGPTADRVTHFWESSVQLRGAGIYSSLLWCLLKMWAAKLHCLGERVAARSAVKATFLTLNDSHLWYTAHTYKNLMQSKQCNIQITVHVDLGGRYGCIANNTERRLWTASIPVCLRQMVSDVSNGV